jgi:hypothetical protein
MTMQNRFFALAALAVTVTACADAPVPQEPSHTAHHARVIERTPDMSRQLAELRRATAHFHNFEKARDAGWDEPITPCWDHADGAMGYHYANPGYLFDEGHVDLLQPEALMYEPGPAGQMRLVGMEYIVFIDDWADPANPPQLLGQTFHPHSFLPIYKLHIWLWRDNPRGIFADWNPKVSCRHADETETF